MSARAVTIIAATLVACSARLCLAVTLTLGSIAENAANEQATFAALVAYLDARSSELGVEGVHLNIEPSVEGMVQSLRDGEVDVYLDSPIVGTLIGRQTGAKPFLRRWKEGNPAYRTLIVARVDSRIETIEDLRGRVIAMDEPFSSSGYLLPKAMLLEHGVETVEAPSLIGPISGSVVGFRFTNGDLNTAYWLVRGRVPAGAISSLSFAGIESRWRRQLKIIARSPLMPRHVLFQRADASPEIIAALRRLLIAMDKETEGIAVLEGFNRTARFDDFPGGTDATFAPIEHVVDVLLRSQGG